MSNKADEIVGMLQKVKDQMGPVIGKIRKYFPESSTWNQQAIDIYERAKSLQDQIGRLR